MSNTDMIINISYEKLKLMLKMTYEEGKGDQLSISEPDAGFNVEPTFEESKAGQWIKATNESNKRKGIRTIPRKNKNIS